MKILKISSENKYFEDVVGLYEAAFPADERREVAEFSRLADTEKKFHINVFVGDNDEFIGFLTFCHQSGNALRRNRRKRIALVSCVRQPSAGD